MALEPITRQEKIIAGQDLEPITRMEMFLKNFGGGGSVPKPLTYDYMPEGYPKKSVLFEIEWDGNTDGLISVDSSGAAYYRVSDVVLTHDDLIGATVEYSDGSNEVLTSGDVSDMSEDVTSGIGMVIAVRQDNSTADDMLFPLKGTYLLYDHGYHATRVIKQTIMPMADEFLPSIPADKLPAGGSSSGQLIVVVYNANLEGTIFAADKTYNEIRAAIESGMSVVIHYKENINATDYRVFYHTKIMNGYYQFCSVEELAGSVFFWYISIHEENGEMGINKQSLRLQVVTT